LIILRRPLAITWPLPEWVLVPAKVGLATGKGNQIYFPIVIDVCGNYLITTL
jgi:hypothetical protein